MHNLHVKKIRNILPKKIRQLTRMFIPGATLTYVCRRVDAGDEVVDGPANDSVVEHPHVDVDDTDGVADPLQHRAYPLPQRQAATSRAKENVNKKGPRK